MAKKPLGTPEAGPPETQGDPAEQKSEFPTVEVESEDTPRLANKAKDAAPRKPYFSV